MYRYLTILAMLKVLVWVLSPCNWLHILCSVRSFIRCRFFSMFSFFFVLELGFFFFLFFFFFFFFFNDTATTEIYTLSLHDALPISSRMRSWARSVRRASEGQHRSGFPARFPSRWSSGPDRKSTRLNSSHDQISYAVFCLKKKKKKNN